MSRVALVNTPDAIQVRVPMKLRKRSGRKLVIVPDGMENARVPNPSDRNTLLIAVARARLWEELIESGRFGSIRELAESIGLDSAYVARIMRLTLLSPEIVKAIVDGEEPEGLSYRALVKPFPVIWEEQRIAFGPADDGSADDVIPGSLE